MPLFDHLPAPSRARLDTLAEALVVPAGEAFIRAGETDGDLFRLERGSVEVVDSRGPTEVVLDVMGPGAVVGEMAFVGGEPRSAEVRALEDSALSRWRAARLREALEQDAVLARDFYHALSLAMVERARAAQGPGRPIAAPGTGAGGAWLGWARALGERVKGELLALEGPMRRPERGPAQQALGELWGRLVEEGGRGFHGLSLEEAQRAGQALARELHPYLLRARTGELTLGRGGLGHSPAALRHLEAGLPHGADPLGVALDGLLLGAPTASAHRERLRVLEQVLPELLPAGRPARALVLGCGSGAVVAAVARQLRPGSALVGLDGDRELLGRLGATTLGGGQDLGVRMLSEDLARVALGYASPPVRDQDLLVCSGLVEYLPELAVVNLLGYARAALAPGGLLVVDHLRNSVDRFVFDHLLGWPTLRRSRQPFAELLAALGLDEVRALPCRGAVMVLVGRAAG